MAGKYRRAKTPAQSAAAAKTREEQLTALQGRLTDHVREITSGPAWAAWLAAAAKFHSYRTGNSGLSEPPEWLRKTGSRLVCCSVELTARLHRQLLGVFGPRGRDSLFLAVGGPWRGLLPRTWCPEADVHKLVLTVGSDDQRDARGGADPVATGVGQPSCVPSVWAVRDDHTAAGGRIWAPADGEATFGLVGSDQLKVCSRFDDQACLGKQPQRWIGPAGTGLQCRVTRACGQGYHAEHDLEAAGGGWGSI